MIFTDYPEISREDYKIPNGISLELMGKLVVSKDAFDWKIHDYFILVGTGKFKKKQIQRMLYMTRYGEIRLRKRIKQLMREIETRQECEPHA